MPPVIAWDLSVLVTEQAPDPSQGDAQGEPTLHCPLAMHIQMLKALDIEVMTLPVFALSPGENQLSDDIINRLGAAQKILSGSVAECFDASFWITPHDQLKITRVRQEKAELVMVSKEQVTADKRSSPIKSPSEKSVSPIKYMLEQLYFTICEKYSVQEGLNRLRPYMSDVTDPNFKKIKYEDFTLLFGFFCVSKNEVFQFCSSLQGIAATQASHGFAEDVVLEKLLPYFLKANSRVLFYMLYYQLYDMTQSAFVIKGSKMIKSVYDFQRRDVNNMIPIKYSEGPEVTPISHLNTFFSVVSISGVPEPVYIIKAMQYLDKHRKGFIQGQNIPFFALVQAGLAGVMVGHFSQAMKVCSTELYANLSAKLTTFALEQLDKNHQDLLNGHSPYLYAQILRSVLMACLEFNPRQGHGVKADIFQCMPKEVLNLFMPLKDDPKLSEYAARTMILWILGCFKDALFIQKHFKFDFLKDFMNQVTWSVVVNDHEYPAIRYHAVDTIKLLQQKFSEAFEQHKTGSRTPLALGNLPQNLLTDINVSNIAMPIAHNVFCQKNYNFSDQRPLNEFVNNNIFYISANYPANEYKQKIFFVPETDSKIVVYGFIFLNSRDNDVDLSEHYKASLVTAKRGAWLGQAQVQVDPPRLVMDDPINFAPILTVSRAAENHVSVSYHLKPDNIVVGENLSGKFNSTLFQTEASKPRCDYPFEYERNVLAKLLGKLSSQDPEQSLLAIQIEFYLIYLHILKLPYISSQFFNTIKPFDKVVTHRGNSNDPESNPLINTDNDEPLELFKSIVKAYLLLEEVKSVSWSLNFTSSWKESLANLVLDAAAIIIWQCMVHFSNYFPVGVGDPTYYGGPEIAQDVRSSLFLLPIGVGWGFVRFNLNEIIFPLIKSFQKTGPVVRMKHEKIEEYIVHADQEGKRFYRRFVSALQLWVDRHPKHNHAAQVCQLIRQLTIISDKVEHMPPVIRSIMSGDARQITGSVDDDTVRAILRLRQRECYDRSWLAYRRPIDAASIIFLAAVVTMAVILFNKFDEQITAVKDNQYMTELSILNTMMTNALAFVCMAFISGDGLVQVLQVPYHFFRERGWKKHESNSEDKTPQPVDPAEFTSINIPT